MTMARLTRWSSWCPGAETWPRAAGPGVTDTGSVWRGPASVTRAMTETAASWVCAPCCAAARASTAPGSASAGRAGRARSATSGEPPPSSAWGSLDNTCVCQVRGVRGARLQRSRSLRGRQVCLHEGLQGRVLQGSWLSWPGLQRARLLHPGRLCLQEGLAGGGLWPGWPRREVMWPRVWRSRQPRPEVTALRVWPGLEWRGL